MPQEMQGRVIGIGETIMDILFKNGKPIAAVPGGSCFNSVVSIGRAGIPCCFLGYSGNDVLGRQMRDFLMRNDVSAEFFELREGEKSAVSLAFLDENGDSDYIFYKFSPRLSERLPLPCVGKGDAVLMSSYFSISEGTHFKVRELLHSAVTAGATVYYDVNFRRTHADEKEALMPAIEHNMRSSTIVRGSADDFETLFGTRDPMEIYWKHVALLCPIFICTSGGGDILVCTPHDIFRYPAPQISEVVSTVGAGDSFNAGIVYALMHNGSGGKAPRLFNEAEWKAIISCACGFASDTCQSTDNYISTTFANGLKYQK